MKCSSPVVLAVLAALAVVSCSDSEDVDPAAASVPGDTSVQGSVTGTGAPGTLSETRDVSDATFGATISGETLTIVIPGPGGLSIEVVRRTGVRPIPGSVALDGGGDAVSVIVKSAAGTFENVAVGRVSIDNCPRAVADSVSGQVTDVGVRSADGAISWLVDLDFAVVVTTASGGGLSCTTGGGSGDADAGVVPVCDNRVCGDEGGTCCSYQRCLDRDCRTACRLQPCDEGDVDGCRQRCLVRCLETCQASGACRAAAEAYWQCQVGNACFSSDDEDVCSREHCCEEFRATY